LLFMTRIFITLAAAVALALLATFALGCASRFVSHDLYMIHFNLGLFAALGTLLVHCLIFTYFLGTGRWVKEVALAYSMPDRPWPKLTRELKRKTFPPALFAMLITIATAAAGAGAQVEVWHWLVHASLALATLAVNFWAFGVEYRNVGINACAIEAVMAEIDRLRAERGLPSNAEALLEDGFSRE
jgi:hypothetical protein